jgi:hypothetical protein
VTGVIDEHPFSGLMKLAHSGIERKSPSTVEDTELSVGVMVIGVGGSIVFPKKLASNTGAFEFEVNGGKVRLDEKRRMGLCLEQG